jgi:serine/threonine-protein kinase
MVGRIFLGRYEAVRLLGEGGMGRVYLARQIDLGRQVVVKVMHDHIAADPKFRERFERETHLMADVEHAYVVRLYDFSFTAPEGPCIVMEYIRGVTLDTLLHRNVRLGAPRVARLLSQLCEALHAAHSKGIIHRDLKPANLMVVEADSPYGGDPPRRRVRGGQDQGDRHRRRLRRRHPRLHLAGAGPRRRDGPPQRPV